MNTYGQHRQQNFSKDVYLRGSITPEREWWDLTYYHLDITKPDEEFISGTNTIRYKVIKPYDVIQVDLQPPMSIEKVTQNGDTLAFKKSGLNAYLILLDEPQEINTSN